MKAKIIIKQKANDGMQVKIKGIRKEEAYNTALNMLCTTTACECVKAGIKKTEFINYMKEFYDDAKKSLEAYLKEND